MRRLRGRAPGGRDAVPSRGLGRWDVGTQSRGASRPRRPPDRCKTIIDAVQRPIRTTGGGSRAPTRPPWSRREAPGRRGAGGAGQGPREVGRGAGPHGSPLAGGGAGRVGDGGRRCWWRVLGGVTDEQHQLAGGTPCSTGARRRAGRGREVGVQRRERRAAPGERGARGRRAAPGVGAINPAGGTGDVGAIDRAGRELLAGRLDVGHGVPGERRRPSPLAGRPGDGHDGLHRRSV